MKIINKDETWFIAEEGQRCFSEAESLEERLAFLFSYLFALRKGMNVPCEKDELFKIAFLLADTVFPSDLPYAKPPALLDARQNPFAAFVRNAAVFDDDERLFVSLLSILHGIAEPLQEATGYTMNTL